MKQGEKLLKVYSGPEASAILLQKRLEKAGIIALIKNDSEDAFFGATPQIVDLYVKESTLESAETIIKDLNMSPG
jgi:hypothetical protein